MSIIRVRKDKKYFAASNVPFNDERLSWEARGVMGYLLSKPDDWDVMFSDLVKRGPAGEHKVRRVLKELEEAGYLLRERLTDPGGKFYWVSTIYENPTISRKPVYGATISRLSTRGLSTRGKPRDILNTDSLSTDSLNIEKEGIASQKSDDFRDVPPDLPEPLSEKPDASLKIEGLTTYALGQILAVVCKMDFPSNKGRLLREAKLLLKADPPPEEKLLVQHYGPSGWWFTQDWRGRKGELPSPAAIRETWGRWVGDSNLFAGWTHAGDPVPAGNGGGGARKNGREDGLAAVREAIYGRYNDSERRMGG